MIDKNRIVNCPACDIEVSWREINHFRPFCSERCRLIDFGEWAKEERIIPGKPLPPAESNDEGGSM